ncbi:mitochondrial inner-membrane-bound regulator domain-containing protein [Trichoderma austrokoningii]
MLSRAVNVPRVYWANRLASSILRETTTLSHFYGREDWLQRRCYSSDPIIHSKESVEALISGRISTKEFHKSLRKGAKKPPQKGSSRRGKGARNKRRSREEEIPDWGLANVTIEAEAEAAQEFSRGKNIEEKLPEAQPEAREEEAQEEEAQDALTKTLAEEVLVQEQEQEQAEALLDDAAIVMNTLPYPAEPDQVNPKGRIETRRGFGDRRIQSRSVSVAALGEQIEAIMLKNPNHLRRPKRPARRIQDKAPEAKVELDAERDLMMEEAEESNEEALEAALKHIDDLRPGDRTVLPMKEFDALANTLVDGFKTSQLTRYYNRERVTAHNKSLQKPPSYSWVENLGPWEPARPDHWGPLRPKQRQVVLIMQTIWGLEVKEQVEGLGRTLVWLEPRIFQLIAPPNSSILEQVSQDFLYESNKEKITASFDDCRISVYAQKSTIPVILSHLDEIVKSIRHQKISSHHIEEGDLDEKLLQELEQITKTHIEYNQGSKELEISWLESQTPSPSTEGTKNIETPADIALRLLLEQASKDDQNTVHIITPSEVDKAKDGAFISHQRERRSMRWKDKLKPWSRYVLPVGQATAAAGDDIPEHLLEAISLPASSDSKAKKKEAKLVVTTASFGHVLHGKGSRTVATMAKHRRLLSPVLPHPASFTSIMDEAKPLTQRTTITLNFSPDPKHQVNDTSPTLPSVQLQLPVDPVTDIADSSLPSGSTLFGVAAHSVSDILLPGEGVDIRLTQQRLLPLDASQEPIKDFLSHCEFDLPRGILRTPSKVTFSVPKVWAADPKAKRKPAKTATIKAPYIFMGLETHQIAEFEFHGHTLRYDGVDAGRHGGHRQELSLQAGPPVQGSDEDKNKAPAFELSKEEASAFLSLAGEVATGKYFSWHNGAEMVRELDDESLGLGELDDEVIDEELSSLGGEESEILSPAEQHESTSPTTEPAAEDASSVATEAVNNPADTKDS